MARHRIGLLGAFGHSGREPVSAAASFTLYVTNEALGTAHFRGAFDSLKAAQTYAKQQAEQSRRFVRFEVWTGTPQNPGKYAGFGIRGGEIF